METSSFERGKVNILNSVQAVPPITANPPPIRLGNLPTET